MTHFDPLQYFFFIDRYVDFGTGMIIRLNVFLYVKCTSHTIWYAARSEGNFSTNTGMFISP